MKTSVQESHFEPRWPVALTIVSVLLLLAALPERVTVFPMWVQYLVIIVVLMPMSASRLAGAQSRWLYIERWTTLLLFLFAGGGTIAGLGYLIHAMVNRTAELSGVQLLTSSIAAWVTNVLIFSLLYWQIDRGGPEARVNRVEKRVDWLFPQEGALPQMCRRTGRQRSSTIFSSGMQLQRRSAPPMSCR